MKKISIALNVILIAGLLYVSCKQNHSNDSNFSQGTNKQNKTSIQPIARVKAEDLIQAVVAYRKTYLNALTSKSMINSKNAKANTRLGNNNPSLWVSLSTVRNFIDYVKEYSKSINKNENDLGVRFYFGLNADTNQVIYMIPTVKIGNEAADFDPYKTFLLNKKGVDSIAYMSYALNNKDTNTSITTLALDSTRLCPPTCPMYKFSLLKFTDAQ